MTVRITHTLCPPFSACISALDAELFCRQRLTVHHFEQLKSPIFLESHDLLFARIFPACHLKSEVPVDEVACGRTDMTSQPKFFGLMVYRFMLDMGFRSHAPGASSTIIQYCCQYFNIFWAFLDMKKASGVWGLVWPMRTFGSCLVHGEVLFLKVWHLLRLRATFKPMYSPEIMPTLQKA